MMQALVDFLTNPDFLKILAELIVLVWVFVKIKTNLSDKKYQLAIEALEQGVEETYEEFVRGIKLGREDGKLTNEEIKEAQKRAIDAAWRYGKTKGVDIIKTLGKEYLPVLIAKLISSFKSKK